MAQRSTHPLETPKSECHLLTAQLTGGGAGLSLVNAESANQGGGEIVSATYVSTGVFTIVFRNPYPALKAVLGCENVGTTAGLRGQFTAIDVAAKTGTFKTYVGSVLTDPATTDTLYPSWIVRNSGRNA